MARAAVFILAMLGLVGTNAPAGAASSGYRLELVVPLSCQVRHSPVSASVMTGAAVSLGQLNEYCNAARGYELVVRYAPGTMEGAVLSLGDDQIVLNGSGQAVISRSSGARMRTRQLAAVPGQAGFDTDRLDFSLTPL
jgi:hypothetical protein